MRKNFKVGQRVRVISQGWSQSKLVGKIGTIATKTRYITDGNFEYCIVFPDWDYGHAGNAECRRIAGWKPYNCYNLGARSEDDMELVMQEQLEFNFENFEQ